MRNNDVFASIRPTKINFYLRYMEMLGFSQKEVLANTGLTPEALRDRYTMIAIPDYICVVSNMLRLTGRPTITFEMAEILAPSDVGILGHALAACTNIAEGVDVWRKYSPLFFGSLIQLEIYSDKNYYWSEYIPIVKLQPHLLQFFVEEKMCLEQVIFRRFNGLNVKNSFFSFTYPAPQHANLYKELLQSKIFFNARRNLGALNYHDTHYDEPFPAADRETLELCTNYLDNLTGIINTHTTLEAKVRFTIRELLPNVPTLAEMARTLNCSTRTFCRRLKLEGTTYQKVIAEVRNNLTLNYLITTDLSVNEIAALVGFSETSSLRRAIKQWTGRTISEIKSTVF